MFLSFTRNRKLVNLVMGAFIGQGSMLLTSFVLISTEHPLAGALTTALGVNALLLVVIDWGGQVLQRQAASADMQTQNPLEFAIARLPILLLVTIALIIVPGELYGDDGVKRFLLASSVGLWFSIANMSGFLDVADEESAYGLISGLNYLLVAVYVSSSLFFGFSLRIEIAGWINGAALAGIALMTLRWAQRQQGARRRASLDRESIGYLIKEGFVVSLTLLPGQVIARVISVSILGAGGGHEAAKFNFMKSFSGVFNQCVILLRRSGYSKLHSMTLNSGTRRFRTFSAQYPTILAGVAGLLCGGLALFLIRDRLGLSAALIVAVCTHGACWLLSSSYFYHYQIVSWNWLPSLHAILTCMVVVASVLFVTKVDSAVAGILTELCVSFFCFGIIFLVDRTRVR
ncbi:hypothetical protein E5S69_25060 [Cupriavidus necator]|uniref:hypothetical protein n=1 Tax=Cupriavidus necator TaxID=106590 RepID=UPI00149084E4|nr:hypothetical protein [Cupriavidus necator]NOV26771.1 hypothetical protein [Cupriavidus necator]